MKKGWARTANQTCRNAQDSEKIFVKYKLAVQWQGMFWRNIMVVLRKYFKLRVVPYVCMSCIGAVWQAVLGRGFVDASQLLASTSCTCFEHMSGKRWRHQRSKEYKNNNAILTCPTLKQLTMKDLTSHDVSVTARSRVSSSTVSVKTWKSSCAS